MISHYRRSITELDDLFEGQLLASSEPQFWGFHQTQGKQLGESSTKPGFGAIRTNRDAYRKVRNKIEIRNDRTQRIKLIDNVYRHRRKEPHKSLYHLNHYVNRYRLYMRGLRYNVLTRFGDRGRRLTPIQLGRREDLQSYGSADSRHKFYSPHYRRRYQITSKRVPGSAHVGINSLKKLSSAKSTSHVKKNAVTNRDKVTYYYKPSVKLSTSRRREVTLIYLKSTPRKYDRRVRSHAESALTTFKKPIRGVTTARQLNHNVSMRRSFWGRKLFNTNQRKLSALTLKRLPRLPLRTPKITQLLYLNSSRISQSPVKLKRERPGTTAVLGYTNSRVSRNYASLFSDDLAAQYVRPSLGFNIGWDVFGGKLSQSSISSWVGKLKPRLQPIMLHLSKINLPPHTSFLSTDRLLPYTTIHVEAFALNRKAFNAPRTFSELSYDRILSSTLSKTPSLNRAWSLAPHTGYFQANSSLLGSDLASQSSTFTENSYFSVKDVSGGWWSSYMGRSALSLVSVFMRGHTSQIRGPLSPARRRAGVSVENT